MVTATVDDRSIAARALTFLTLGFLGGCGLLPDAAADPARGAGTSSALIVAEHATEAALSAGRRPGPSCRHYEVPSQGPIRVVTELLFVVKAPGVPARRWWETREWVRDLEGDVAWTIELATRLPDGRPTRRILEDRIVDGQAYSAVDARFVDASRVSGLRDRVAVAPMRSVDELLAYIDVEMDGRAVPASPARGLCRSDRRLPPADAVSLTLGERTRGGWIRWEDRYTHMIVRFEETLRSVDQDVEAPVDIWPIDPDESYSGVTAFIGEGLEAGWLEEPRFNHEATDVEAP